ncbi:helix-turn-helix domain-containing protein [Streptosporangium sandarakinum]|uniref:helix-turn-helix domain-containing protein n=1 Tax=Streptosporangium sandarakinum TaxID=1260955 RepID=UPI00368FC71F
MTKSDLDQKARAVVLLARGASTDKTGQEVGVSGRTVRRWREDPNFEAEVQAAGRELLAEAVAALGAATRDAITALHDALNDDAPHIRVRAASVLLGALPAISEHARLEQRIAALEAVLIGQRAA